MSSSYYPEIEKELVYDALINYISALGYTDSGEKMEFWPGVHLIGKDILRHHAALWPAMLMSLELPVPKRVVAHGWWLVSGQKMSKSVGNIFSPQDLVSHIENSVGLAEDIAVDALRYFMLAAGPQRDDADLSLEALWGPTMQIWQTTTVIYFTAYWAS